MSTPQQNANGPKRSARKQKAQPPPAGPTPRGAVSETELSHPHLDVGEDGKGLRRKSHAPKSREKQAVSSGNLSDATVDRAKATPVKSPAYAGATFTNSPAASALPMPSFYSKSVPNNSHMSFQPPIAEQDSTEPTPVAPLDPPPSKPQATPLDFLFDAARKSRAIPRGDSPNLVANRLSISAHSPASRSPAAREREAESVFPFELDGASTPGEDGSSFTPSYRDRIEAARSARPTSNGVRGELTEAERHERTAALKKALIMEHSPSPPASRDSDDPFNTRPAPVRSHLSAPVEAPRSRSSPSTPGTFTPNAAHQSVAGQHYFPPTPAFPQYALHQGFRQSSNLRHHYDSTNDWEPSELSSDAAVTPPRISTARKPSEVVPYDSPPVPMRPAMPPQQSKPSAQQMEEQMRDFLKLNLAPKT